LAYSVAVEKEAVDKAVKTRQIGLDGKEVEEKDNKCYFCGGEVDAVLAEIRKKVLGHVICNDCVVKIIEVISFAGARTL